MIAYSLCSHHFNYLSSSYMRCLIYYVVDSFTSIFTCLYIWFVNYLNFTSVTIFICIYDLWMKYILPKYHYLWQYCPYAKYFMMMWIISLLVWISVKRTGGKEGTEIISVNIYHAPPLRLVPACLEKQQSRAHDVSSDSHGD